VKHALLLLPLLALLFTGCASTHTKTAHRESTQISVGEDSYYELSASNLTRGEVTNVQPPTVVLNSKGNKVLAAIPSDPLAGILTAQDLTVKVGKNQSNAFGKFVGAINNYILGWTAVEGLKAATAQRASDNTLKAAQAAEKTKQTEILSTPTTYIPAEEAVIFPPSR
jgi:hypothetical protein